jgi:hypothetical protein
MTPAGTYVAVAVINGVRWGYASTGTKQVMVPFEIIEGPHAGQVEHWFGSFKTDKGAERTMQSLRYCGWKGDDLGNLGQLNQKVSIVVGHVTWKGKKHSRVSWVNHAAGGAGPKKEMSDKELRLFAASMKPKAAAVEEQAPVSPFDDWDDDA